MHVRRDRREALPQLQLHGRAEVVPHLAAEDVQQRVVEPAEGVVLDHDVHVLHVHRRGAQQHDGQPLAVRLLLPRRQAVLVELEPEAHLRVQHDGVGAASTVEEGKVVLPEAPLKARQPRAEVHRHDREELVFPGCQRVCVDARTARLRRRCYRRRRRGRRLRYRRRSRRCNGRRRRPWRRRRSTPALRRDTLAPRGGSGGSARSSGLAWSWASVFLPQRRWGRVASHRPPRPRGRGRRRVGEAADVDAHVLLVECQALEVEVPDAELDAVRLALHGRNLQPRQQVQEEVQRGVLRAVHELLPLVALAEGPVEVLEEPVHVEPLGAGEQRLLEPRAAAAPEVLQQRLQLRVFPQALLQLLDLLRRRVGEGLQPRVELVVLREPQDGLQERAAVAGGEPLQRRRERRRRVQAEVAQRALGLVGGALRHGPQQQPQAHLRPRLEHVDHLEVALPGAAGEVLRAPVLAAQEEVHGADHRVAAHLGGAGLERLRHLRADGDLL
mmetsp:Transcript_14054/g.41935  ORF Transcript_14054/g.41935 Transcript_14054/m.41935 type:complete len:499 (-) Transcript_14054:2213-3709(-)